MGVTNDVIRKLAMKSRKDTATGHFLAFMYQFLRSDIVQGFFHFAAATVASVGAFQNGVWNWTFIVCFGIAYIIALCVFYRINQYKSQECLSYKNSAALVTDLSTLLYGMKKYGDELQQSIVNDPSFDTFSRTQYFESVAENVCASVFGMLKNRFGNNRFKVSVFQQFQQEGRAHVKMIAEKSAKLDKADSYQQMHCLESDKKLPFFCNVFLNADDDYVILENEDLVSKKFIKIKGHKITTKQYIGIRGITGLDTVGFVLQICTYTKNQFGQQDEMKKFCDENLIPYREVLRVAFNQRLLQETIADSLKNGDAINERYECLSISR